MVCQSKQDLTYHISIFCFAWHVLQIVDFLVNIWKFLTFPSNRNLTWKGCACHKGIVTNAQGYQNRDFSRKSVRLYELLSLGCSSHMQNRNLSEIVNCAIL